MLKEKSGVKPTFYTLQIERDSGRRSGYGNLRCLYDDRV